MITIISDSHVPRRSDTIPDEILEEVKNADLTVHAGDFVSEDLYRDLEDLGEIVAVKGNCDFFELSNSETFERQGIKFGVYHGSGINPRGDESTLVSIAEKMDVDVLINGHTHQMKAVKTEDKILLNPGSCTGVGGGSASTGNPTMMKILDFDPLELREITLNDGELKSSSRTFEL